MIAKNKKKGQANKIIFIINNIFLDIKKIAKTKGPITDEKFFNSFGIISHKGNTP